jgi:hypothetical protein
MPFHLRENGESGLWQLSITLIGLAWVVLALPNISYSYAIAISRAYGALGLVQWESFSQSRRFFSLSASSAVYGVDSN